MLLQVTDGRVHVWRQGKSLFAPKHIQATIQDSTGSVTIWLCVSYGCNVDLVTMQGTLTVEKYHTGILNQVPHFDSYPLRGRPVYMDDNALPH